MLNEYIIQANCYKRLHIVAAAEVDRLCETKGMDWIDREQAKREATQQAHQLYDQNYAGELVT